MTAATYDNSLNAQLANAEAELVFLDNAFSRFLASTEEGLWDWVADSLNFTTNDIDGARDAARRAIAGSIAQLHASFLDAVGGKPIDWSVWWELAKATETHMKTVSQYNNTYGDVGGRLEFATGEGREELGELADNIKDALPSEGKLWLGVGVVVLVLFLVLAIKLS